MKCNSSDLSNVLEDKPRSIFPSVFQLKDRFAKQGPVHQPGPCSVLTFAWDKQHYVWQTVRALSNEGQMAVQH